MTEQEAIKILDEIGPPALSDSETDHLKADDTLLEFLRSNGYGRLAKAYQEARERVEFWYA